VGLRGDPLPRPQRALRARRGRRAAGPSVRRAGRGQPGPGAAGRGLPRRRQPPPVAAGLAVPRAAGRPAGCPPPPGRGRGGRLPALLAVGPRRCHRRHRDGGGQDRPRAHGRARPCVRAGPRGGPRRRPGVLAGLRSGPTGGTGGQASDRSVATTEAPSTSDRCAWACTVARSPL
jgi:hypothetical protein